MKGGRYSKTSFAASVVSLLLIAGQISTSVEQQTQHNIDRNSDLSRESSTNLPSYDLSQLSRNVARCVSHSDDVARALTDIRSSVQRMATASSTSSGAVALPGGCNCSISNDSGCTGIKQQLVELHRDVSAIKSRSEQSSTATSHVSATNASAAGECYIDLRSTGCNDGAFRGCHVRANWTNVHHAEPAGIYLALVDPVTCKGTPFPVVNPSDAGAAAAVTLSMYINLLTFGQVVVGATCNDCYRNLSPATPALESIGVQGLNRLNLCGKLAFVAQKGSPRKTLSVVKQAAEGNSWLVVKVIVGIEAPQSGGNIFIGSSTPLPLSGRVAQPIFTLEAYTIDAKRLDRKCNIGYNKFC